MQAAQDLHVSLSALAPIAGVSIGDPNDKSTWRIDFSGATPAQMAAAQSVLAGFDFNAVRAPITPMTPMEKFSRLGISIVELKALLGLA